MFSIKNEQKAIEKGHQCQKPWKSVQWTKYNHLDQYHNPRRKRTRQKHSTATCLVGTCKIIFYQFVNSPEKFLHQERPTILFRFATKKLATVRPVDIAALFAAIRILLSSFHAAPHRPKPSVVTDDSSIPILWHPGRRKFSSKNDEYNECNYQIEDNNTQKPCRCTIYTA